MPVTNQLVKLTEKWIDTKLIDVSPHNKRSPLFLDRHTLQDILPSIEKNKQSTPGLVRPQSNGRYELIFGSRRLKCAILLQRQYFTLIGEIPDADVERLSDIENESMEVGHYEKALHYANLINNGILKSWDQVPEKEGCAIAHAYRLKEISKLETSYVNIFPLPSKASFRHLKFLIKECDRNAVFAKETLTEILQMKKSGEHSYSSLSNNEQAISLFKKILNVKSVDNNHIENPAPDEARSEILIASNYNNENVARMKTSKLGNRTIYIEKIADSDVEAIWDFIKERVSVRQN
jgi:ParB family chromosome partitioning protein